MWDFLFLTDLATVNKTAEKISIRNWSDDDKPREKLLAKGRQALTDSELIAILIGSGNDKESAVELSRRILSSFNNSLSTIAQLSINELKVFRGIGEAKAISIIAGLEIGLRRKEQSVELNQQLLSSKDGFNYLVNDFHDLKHEEFWVIYLNRANRIIKKQCMSSGGVSGTIADIRMILKVAIDHLASYIIVAHNHPSGNLKPSQEDVNLTRKIKQAGELMDVRLIDHLIISNVGYYSFADEGNL